MDKVRKPYDFYTATIFTTGLNNKEYAVELGVCGYFETENGHLSPVPSKIIINKVKLCGKEIPIFKELEDYVRREIVNSPKNFKKIIIIELGKFLNSLMLAGHIKVDNKPRI